MTETATYHHVIHTCLDFSKSLELWIFIISSNQKEKLKQKLKRLFFELWVTWLFSEDTFQWLPIIELNQISPVELNPGFGTPVLLFEVAEVCRKASQAVIVLGISSINASACLCSYFNAGKSSWWWHARFLGQGWPQQRDSALHATISRSAY